MLVRIDSHLIGWKSNLLSFVSRLTLVKSVLSTDANHTIQILYLPRLICVDIDKKIKDFLYGNSVYNVN